MLDLAACFAKDLSPKQRQARFSRSLENGYTDVFLELLQNN
jgi:hypothetical protein